MNSGRKVLHIAPENTAGVPYNVMAMQNMYNMPARLLTFYKIPYNFPEDICLNLTLPRSKLAMKWREYKQSKLHANIGEQNIDKWTHMPYFAPKNSFERAYMRYRENRNKSKVLKALEILQSDEFNIIHFDGGIDFFSDSRLAKRWKSQGKKIINCYFGDDLRTRGIVKEMDELSDLNLTFEYDHTLRHPNIHFLFFPFDNSVVHYIPDEIYNKHDKIRIVHSPTHRFIKGTEEIIKAVEKVSSARNIEFVLVENTPREQVIKIKQTCHIAIDQIGNRGGTGYGINSLETLSMGLPTITDMNCGMDTWLPENPFTVANSDNLPDKLIGIIDNLGEISKQRSKLREWVNRHHSYKSVFEKLEGYYKEHGIL